MSERHTPAGRLLDFRRHLRPEISEGEGAYLFSERGVIAMRGAQIAALAALLDGTRDFAGVLRACPPGLTSDQVGDLLSQLVAADLVTLRAPGDLKLDEGALAYWDACGVDAGSAAREQSAGVGLVRLGDHVDAALVERSLTESGLQVVGSGDAALSVVLCDDYLDPRLAGVDAAHRAGARPWLLARPVGSQVWLGPIFQPGVSGCWHCLSNRLWGHRYAEACVQAALGRVGPARRTVPSVPPLVSAAAHLIALEVAKWLAGYRYPGQQCVWVLDTLDLQGRLHELRRRPQCPACGDPGLVAARGARPVRLRPAPKTATGGGGHRTLTPGQVLDRYRHLTSPVTGIVKEIVAYPNAPAFVNAYRSGPNVVRGPVGIAALRDSLRAENGGKGATPLDAEVGALCEAVERFSGSYQGDEPRVLGSFRALAPEALHPNDCMLFDERQYRNRDRWNAEHAGFQYVCAPFDEEEELDWTPLWPVTGGPRRLLPTALLYYGAPAPSGTLRPDSNGCAAGSSVEDAVLQGILELVERDAVALWWYNRTPVPGMDIASFGDRWLAEMLDRYADIGRQLWALDLTSDLGVPVVAAVSRATGGGGERVMFGFGAHLDPRVAVYRAVAELNQMLPTVLAGTLRAEDEPDAAAWLATATVATQRYLTPLAGVPARTPADFAYTYRADVRDDVLALAGLLAGHGMDTLVLDQTRPDVGLPVVRVVVPGLRSFWARFAPGRLFDVPVRLGRLGRPTPYEELNPIPMFL